MNKIKTLSLLLLALPLLLTSCLKDNNDIFGDSTSARLQAALSETRQVLRSAENGWVMDYYVGTDQAYGGYAFIVKFDSLNVTAVSEVTRTPDTSNYKLTTDNGPVLTFDTYNQVLHELATPSSSNYEGYHADFEFQVVSATPELVVLRGRRTGNVMQLRPLKEDAQAYLDKVENMEQTMLIGSMSMVLNGDSLNGQFDLDGRSLSFVNADSSYTLQTAYTYTDKGIRLYESVETKGYTLSEFSYDASAKQFTCLDNGAEGLVINGLLPDTYVYFDQLAGDYTFTYLMSQQDNENAYDTINVDVTLTPMDDQSGFKVSGLVNGLDVVLEYNKSFGTLALNTQVIGEVSGNYLWLQAADFKDGGSLYPGYAEFGMNATWNKDMETPVLNFKTNGNETLPTDSYCLWLTNKSGESQGQYKNSDYYFNPGYSLMLYVKKLTKKTAFPVHED